MSVTNLNIGRRRTADASPSTLIREAYHEGVSDQHEVASFCERLKGMTSADLTGRIAEPDNAPLPQGYHEVRLHDRRDGSCLGSILWDAEIEIDRYGPNHRVSAERPTAQHIISICLNLVFEEVTEWRSTVAMASSRPGVLDLEVNIETRPRRHLPGTGAPLSDDLAEWFAARAPAKAGPKPSGA